MCGLGLPRLRAMSVPGCQFSRHRFGFQCFLCLLVRCEEALHLLKLLVSRHRHPSSTSLLTAVCAHLRHVPGDSLSLPSFNVPRALSRTSPRRRESFHDIASSEYPRAQLPTLLVWTPRARSLSRGKRPAAQQWTGRPEAPPGYRGSDVRSGDPGPCNGGALPSGTPPLSVASAI